MSNIMSDWRPMEKSRSHTHINPHYQDLELIPWVSVSFHILKTKPPKNSALETRFVVRNIVPISHIIKDKMQNFILDNNIRSRTFFSLRIFVLNIGFQHISYYTIYYRLILHIFRENKFVTITKFHWNFFYAEMENKITLLMHLWRFYDVREAKVSLFCRK